MPSDTHSADEIHDALLIVRCQLGEDAALQALVQGWSGRLLRHLQRLVGADLAHDVAQEVWIRAFRGIVRLRDGARLGPWLFGIAHNVAMDRLRARYSEHAALAEVAIRGDLQEPDDTAERLDRLEECLADLPPLERETLTLFYLEDMTLAQVAEIQRVPEGTVKSRLFRARHMLRLIITKDNDDAR